MKYISHHKIIITEIYSKRFYVMSGFIVRAYF